jgi:serine/threonine-protein kinase
MLAGEPPFTGPTAQAVVARVMTEEPRALSGQRKTVPPGVEAAVFTALAKLPADRYATAAEFAADLKNPTGTMMRTGFRPVASAGKRGWVVGALVVVAALAVGALVGRSTRTSSTGVTDVVRATISLGKEAPVRALGTLRLAVSRDGRRIVYTGGTGPEANLWVREIGGQDPRLLPETEGAFAPFFSPDGESIGFFITKGGGRPEMRVVPIQGGVARTVVADSVSGFGADWADDGNIYFSHANLGIAKVSSGGGAIVQISRPDSSAGVSEHDFPVIVPGNKFALAMLWRGSIGSNRIGLIELKSGTVTDLASGTHVRYAAPGFILIGDAGRNILAARFDPKSGTLKGTPTLMVRGVQVDGGNGTLQFALSATGTLVYQGGGAEGGLTWVARDGSMTPVDTTMKGTHTSFTVSPDGQALAVAQSEAGSEGVWIKQLPAGAFTKLSTDVADANRPVWTPDGRFVAFLGIRDSRRTAWIRRADGSDQTRPVAPGMPEVDEILHHPDGRHLLLRSRGSGPGSRYLMVMEPTVDSLPRDLIRGTADSYEIAISPNGRWLAYVSEESGSAEVYVRPFPNVDSARIAISVGGGVEPLWSRDGTELFYRSSRGDAMATAVSTTTTFSHSQPVLMFSNPGFSVGSYFRGWDVHPDGRFLMSKTEGSNTSELEVILNWTRELERLEVAP